MNIVFKALLDITNFIATILSWKNNSAFYTVKLVLDFGILSCYARVVVATRDTSRPRYFGNPGMHQSDVLWTLHGGCFQFVTKAYIVLRLFTIRQHRDIFFRQYLHLKKGKHMAMKQLIVKFLICKWSWDKFHISEHSCIILSIIFNVCVQCTVTWRDMMKTQDVIRNIEWVFTELVRI